MNPTHTVLSLISKDITKAYSFYKDGLGLEKVTQLTGIIQIELPGMTLFLADEQSFTKYTQHAQTRAHYPATTVEGFLSCALETQAEVDEILAKAKAAGAEIFPTQITKHALNGYTQYLGYFKDLDGHLWQLVYNLSKPE